MEHTGVVHDRLGLRRTRLVDATGVRRQRVRPRRGPPQARRSRPGLPLRPGRARLPQALLRHLPGAASGVAAAARRGPGGARRRDLQRAEHQPHRQRDDDPELRLRHRLPARHPRRRPADRLAAGRLRPRPPVPRTRRQGRAHRERVGPRAPPPVGTAPPALGPGPHRRHHRHAVRERVRVDLAERRRRPDALHARPLRPGVGAPARTLGRGRRRHRVPPLPGPETRCGDTQHVAPGRRRLLPAEQLGDRAAPVVERQLRMAEVRLRDHADVHGPRPRGTRRAAPDTLAAEPRHEPGLHRARTSPTSTRSRRSALRRRPPPTPRS